MNKSLLVINSSSSSSIRIESTMLIKIQLYSIFSFVLLVFSKDIILKLDTKQVIDSIISEASVKYLTELAQVFAKKAAETFLKQIQNKEQLLSDSNRAKLVAKKPIHRLRLTTTTEKSETQEVLNEEEAYKLLDKPPPDGDNLGWHSQEDIREGEDREEAKAVPLTGLMKVNGIYVRRLLGVGDIL